MSTRGSSPSSLLLPNSHPAPPPPPHNPIQLFCSSFLSLCPTICSECITNSLKLYSESCAYPSLLFLSSALNSSSTARHRPHGSSAVSNSGSGPSWLFPQRMSRNWRKLKTSLKSSLVSSCFSRHIWLKPPPHVTQDTTVKVSPQLHANKTRAKQTVMRGCWLVGSSLLLRRRHGIPPRSAARPLCPRQVT